MITHEGVIIHVSCMIILNQQIHHQQQQQRCIINRRTIPTYREGGTYQSSSCQQIIFSIHFSCVILVCHLPLPTTSLFWEPRTGTLLRDIIMILMSRVRAISASKFTSNIISRCAQTYILFASFSKDES